MEKKTYDLLKLGKAKDCKITYYEKSSEYPFIAIENRLYAKEKGIFIATVKSLDTGFVFHSEGECRYKGELCLIEAFEVINNNCHATIWKNEWRTSIIISELTPVNILIYKSEKLTYYQEKRVIVEVKEPVKLDYKVLIYSVGGILYPPSLVFGEEKGFEIHSVICLKKELVWMVGYETQYGKILGFQLSKLELYPNVMFAIFGTSPAQLYNICDLEKPKEKEEKKGVWECFDYYPCAFSSIFSIPALPRWQDFKVPFTTIEIKLPCGRKSELKEYKMFEQEKAVEYPNGITAFKKSDGTYSTWDCQKQFNTYNGWVRYNLGEKGEIYEVENKKGEVFKVKDWVGFWIEGFGINTSNEIYAYCTWAFPDKTILLSELKHKDKPKDSGNWRKESSETLLKEAFNCPITFTMPKAETFETGKSRFGSEGALNHAELPNFIVYYHHTEDSDEVKKYKTEANKFIKECNGYRSENAELKKKVEELEKHIDIQFNIKAYHRYREDAKYYKEIYQSALGMIKKLSNLKDNQ